MRKGLLKPFVVLTLNRLEEPRDILAGQVFPNAFEILLGIHGSAGDRSVFERYDFAYADGSLKLLEINADIPGLLYESGHLQLDWWADLRILSSTASKAGQFNVIRDLVIETFKNLIATGRVLQLGTISVNRSKL